MFISKRGRVKDVANRDFCDAPLQYQELGLLFGKVDLSDGKTDCLEDNSNLTLVGLVVQLIVLVDLCDRVPHLHPSPLQQERNSFRCRRSRSAKTSNTQKVARLTTSLSEVNWRQSRAPGFISNCINFVTSKLIVKLLFVLNC